MFTFTVLISREIVNDQIKIELNLCFHLSEDIMELPPVFIRLRRVYLT